MKKKLTIVEILVLLFLILYTAFFVFFFLWAVLTAFKSQFDYRINLIGFPKKWVWNFDDVFNNFFVNISVENGTRKVYFMEQLYNTLVYAVGGAFCGVIFNVITAYLCACFKYKFGGFWHSLVLFVMVCPTFGGVAAYLNLLNTLKIYDTMLSIFMMQSGGVGGVTFLVLYNSFKAVSKDLPNAARIDGAGNFTIFTRIMVPMVLPQFFLFFLMAFIGHWNDYSVNLYYLPSRPVVSLGLLRVSESTILGLNTTPMRITGAIIVALPVIVLYAFFNKHMMGNASMGAIKG